MTVPNHQQDRPILGATLSQEKNMGEYQYKGVDVAGFDVQDEGNGIVTAIVSVTGIKDSVKDIIQPGAYKDTLTKRMPKGIWHHDWHQPIAKTIEADELLPLDARLPKTLPNGKPWPAQAGALLVKTQFNMKTERGRTAYEDVKFFGNEQEWSIGYRVPDGAAMRTPDGTRHIKSLDLFEYSPVLVGTMASAHTVSVKDAQTAWREADGIVDTDELFIKNGLAVDVKALTEDYEVKTAGTMEVGEGVGMDDDEVKALIPQLVDGLTRLGEWLTQDNKRHTQQVAELNAAGQQKSEPVANVLQQAREALEAKSNERLPEQIVEGEEPGTLRGATDAALQQLNLDSAHHVALVQSATEVDEVKSPEAIAKFLDALEDAVDESEDEAKAALLGLANKASTLVVELETKGAEPAVKDAKAGAMPDGSFPITNAGQLRRAIQSVGRAKDQDAAKKHIMARAKAIGAEDKLPVSWRLSKDEKKDAEEAVTLNLAEFNLNALMG